MTRIVVNEISRETEQGTKTWGDLLEALDEDLEGSGNIVTAARFDGVDTPTFRDEAALGVALGELECVEVTSGSASVLLQQCLTEASDALESLSLSAQQIGGNFRGHDVSGANRELSSLAEGLATMLSLVGVIGNALRADFDALRPAGQSARQLIVDTTTHVDTLVEAQSVRDWVSLADVLEYDVCPALDRWRELLGMLRQRAEGGTVN